MPNCRATEATSSTVDSVSYHRQIEPILRARCQGCHQPAKSYGGYVLTSHERLLEPGESGEAAIVPGRPEESELVRQITVSEGMAAMPKQAPPLAAAEVELIRQWILEGAQDDSPAAGPTVDAQHPPIYVRPPLVASLAFAPNGQWLAVSGFHEVILVDAQENRTVHRLVGLSERIQSVSFSPDSTRLAVTGGSPGRFGEVQLWSVETGQLLLSHQVTYDTLFGGSFSPDGRLFAFGATDNVVRAIDTETGEQQLHQGAHEDWSLATVFNPSGTHLISGGRDMTVKLTEVATERFVDNVTSITPGALKGGVHALAMHPTLDQVLVGGADGSPKIYRIFRETARRIGDDANLIRKFPQQVGRIFSLALSADGQQFAVASTLDGNSQVRVYPYQFAGEMPAEVQAALAKPADQRDDADKELINKFYSQTSDPTVSLNIPDSIYAVALHPQRDLMAVGGAAGVVRLYSTTSGELLDELVPVPIASAADQWEGGSDGHLLAGHGLLLPEDARPDRQEEQRLLPEGQLQEITVEPATIELASFADSVQLVVTAHFAAGQTADVTRLASLDFPAELLSVDALGLVRRGGTGATGGSSDRGDSQLQLWIRYAGQAVSVPVQVSSSGDSGKIDFVRDVNPILTRLGCNAGTCHGAQQGKNGFQLSLRGYDPVGDVRALADDLAARRLSSAALDASLMLLKPVGAIPHEGGVLLARDSVYYQVLRRWIAQGAGLERDSQKVARIEIAPPMPVMEREGSWQQFRVTAHYPDGMARDVTHEAILESSNGEVCQSFPGGRVRALRRGEAALLARYEGAYAAASITVMGDRDGFQWQPPETYGAIDRLVADKWQRRKILPSELCPDHVFLRRVRLDLTGLPPTLEELREFLDDPRPSKLKRQAKIDQLLGSEDYVDHWANKWADLLQVNSKFLGAEGAAAFRNWIRTAVASNQPYDEFARALLTATGSNKDNPAASYYKILRDPDLIMENTTHLFLAVRFNCNKCHDHPFERWTQDQYFELAAYFAQTGLKTDPASGDKTIGGTAVEGAKPLYEEVYDQESGEITHARTGQQVAPSFPFPCDQAGGQEGSRREQLAAWITAKDNPYFATSLVNRLWGYLTGTGLIEPLDDIRAGNPPSNPELLRHLTDEFIDSGFDVQHVLRLICNSRVYQLAVTSNPWNADDQLNYSRAKAKRLPAEVLYDAIHRVTGAKSAIPGVESGMRAAQLPDVALNPPDGFLNNLGRPVRESACECERSHELPLGPIMALVSGPTVGSAIGDAENELASLVQREASPEALIEEIYLRVLSRYPSPAEIAVANQLVETIDQDHQALQAALAEREQWWQGQRAVLEQQRLQRLEETRAAATAREQEIAPERMRLEDERHERIATARQALDEYAQDPLRVAAQFLESAGPTNDWFPLAPVALKASNKALLIPQADRSVIASGNADKGTYTIRFRTPLRDIRGFRLEALPLDGAAGGGPGLSPNGNFVITEIEVDAAPVADAKQKTRHPIASGKASFSQGGFDPAATFNGNARDQGGWAVHPRGGIVQWVTYQFAQPIDYEGGVELTFAIHQYHNAEGHRLGRFRISVTTDQAEIQLGLPEEFLAAQTISAAARTEDNVKSLLTYVEKSDTRWNELRAALASAEAPVPPDQPLTELQKLIAELEKPTVDDARLVQMRTDFAASQQQLANRRLTMAQDLTWALINSPAFLFNY